MRTWSAGQGLRARVCRERGGHSRRAPSISPIVTGAGRGFGGIPSLSEFSISRLFMLEGDVGSETLAELRKKVTVAEERLSALGEQLRGTINDLAASARDGVDEKT